MTNVIIKIVMLYARIGSHTNVATIFLKTILILSVATIGLTAHNQKANAQFDLDLGLDLCETYGVSYPEESPSPSPEPSDKFFLATFLQYM
jgi:hypothetical protein